MQIRLTEAEYEAIERKFRNSGLRSRSEFIRAMIFEGYIVNFDEEKFDKIYRLVGSISNNINQIAVRANSTNNVYTEDIVNIKELRERSVTAKPQEWTTFPPTLTSPMRKRSWSR